MTDPTPDPNDSPLPEAVDASDVEELLEQYEQVTAQTDRLEDRVATLEENTVQPHIVRTVLEEYGLSKAKAAEIVEMVQEVEADLRGDGE